MKGQRCSIDLSHYPGPRGDFVVHYGFSPLMATGDLYCNASGQWGLITGPGDIAWLMNKESLTEEEAKWILTGPDSWTTQSILDPKR